MKDIDTQRWNNEPLNSREPLKVSYFKACAFRINKQSYDDYFVLIGRRRHEINESVSVFIFGIIKPTREVVKIMV